MKPNVGPWAQAWAHRPYLIGYPIWGWEVKSCMQLLGDLLYFQTLQSCLSATPLPWKPAINTTTLKDKNAAQVTAEWLTLDQLASNSPEQLPDNLG